MSKKALYIILPIVAIALSLFYVFVIRPNQNIENSTALRAVSPSAPMIIVVDRPSDLLKDIENSEMINTLRTVSSLSEDFLLIDNFSSQFSENELINKFLGNKKMLLSLNFSGKEDINLLSLIEIHTKSDKEIFQKIIAGFKNDPSINVSERKYNRTTIIELQRNDQAYYIALNKGIVMISLKALLVEDAIRLTDSDLANDNPELTPLLKTVGQENIHIFINHDQIHRYLSSKLSDNLKRKSELLKLFAGWTELDIALREDKLLINGFSNGFSENNYFSHVFLNQQPVNSRIERILPQSTAYYTNYCFSDIDQYFLDYENFLEKRNLFFQRKDKLEKLNSKADFNFQQFFSDHLNEEIVFSGINVDQNTPDEGRVWIMEVKSGTTAFSQLMEIEEKYLQKNNIAVHEWQKEYEIDNQTSFTIHRFPFPDMPKILFGQIFSEVKANWVTIYNNYLVFGDSFRAVAKTIHANILGETLASSMDYDKFKNNLNSRSNINFYCNTANSLPVASLVFNSKIGKEVSQNDELRKFKAFAWQMTSTGDMLYNNACLTYSTEIKSKPQTIWQSHIDARFDCKPKFVTNHYDRNNKEIVLHDSENNLYLINNVGRIQWKIKLDASILGEVHQIDYFNNGKLQYLFNTENKLYLIDRNGNSVKNFPVNFRAKASNAVAIFDYDNNKDFRFFVACNDQKIYAYDNSGNLLKGWNIYKTDHLVTNSLQHFRVEGKDYLVASDNTRDYILHRRGTVRVPTKNIYDHTPYNTIYLEERTSKHEPRMVTTSANGTLHYTYFDGHSETLELVKLSPEHYFESVNIDNDEAYEYLFADDNTLLIFDDNGKQLLKKKFSSRISHRPNVYQFSQTSKKIGITCADENKIYLIDRSGNLHPGFPLDGCTEFSIGFISSEKTNFNLLVGSPDSYLYNYYVE